MNYYDSKRSNGLNGINISIQEVENRNQKLGFKPQYGTGNMTHIIALLNEKKNSVSSSKKTKRNATNHASMKKLASVSKNANKSSHSNNLKSNRDHLKIGKHRELKEVMNNSSSSTVLCGSLEAKNKNGAYMSNHIKRMLNASLNSSNPSISAHRNR